MVLLRALYNLKFLLQRLPFRFPLFCYHYCSLYIYIKKPWGTGSDLMIRILKNYFLYLVVVTQHNPDLIYLLLNFFFEKGKRKRINFIFNIIIARTNLYATQTAYVLLYHKRFPRDEVVTVHLSSITNDVYLHFLVALQSRFRVI
jgi:hypothetical protein